MNQSELRGTIMKQKKFSKKVRSELLKLRVLKWRKIQGTIRVYGGYSDHAVAKNRPIVMICPVCALANFKLHSVSWSGDAYGAARKANLPFSLDEINTIIAAADCWSPSEYRQDLEEILNVPS